MKPNRATRISTLADQERVRVLHRDILGHRDIVLYPLPESAAARELARFAVELWKAPKMEGYFDRHHFLDMKEHLREAEHGFSTLAHGGILEVVSIPTLPEDAMGFHWYTVFDPRDATDAGKLVGYGIYSLEKGRSLFGCAEAVRLAFDIFLPYREGRYRKVRFTNHEIYNVSRKILLRYRPSRFVVDVKTQIAQTWTGDAFTRTIYYLKRGYYPPDQKDLADACLVRLRQGQPVGKTTALALLRKSHSPFWIFPVLRTAADGGGPAVKSSRGGHSSNKPSRALAGQARFKKRPALETL